MPWEMGRHQAGTFSISPEAGFLFLINCIQGNLRGGIGFIITEKSPLF